MIVCGTAYLSLRERLLRNLDLTLAKVIKAGHCSEETKRHAKELEKRQASETNRTDMVERKVQRPRISERVLSILMT